MISAYFEILNFYAHGDDGYGKHTRLTSWCSYLLIMVMANIRG